MSAARLRIGVSACIMHADPARTIFHGKPLYYVERSMLRWVGSQGALAYLVPDPMGDAALAADLAADLDGLVLAGGVDVAPQSYGEEPTRPEWSGDAIRDAYELALIRAFVAVKKPVLGVCRGHQVLNVAFGGTLYQDIRTFVEGSLVHRDADVYDSLAHEIDLVPGSSLAALYPGIGRARVNTVHHQAVKDPGPRVVVEARSSTDGVIEALRVEGEPYVRGIQWHPEFAHAMRSPAPGEQPPPDPSTLDNAPLLADFMAAARERRGSPA